MKPLSILVGCEQSQVVCKAFRARGHNAFSCDLIDPSGGHPEWHLKMDVFDAIRLKKWHMGIFFPSCQHLAVSGAKHFAEKRKDGRQQQAIDFFMALVNAPIPKICIENPVGIMSTLYRKPTQIVQPWMFGDPFTKTTCLWLKGLPRLNATNIVDKGKRHITKSGKSLPDWYNLPPSEERSKIRSTTFPGLAKAMATQWNFKNKL
jgi:hypothetical protein